MFKIANEYRIAFHYKNCRTSPTYLNNWMLVIIE